jgi:hypothetical protein
MKTTAQHLEAIRLLLLEQSAAVATASTTAQAATAARDQRSATVKGLHAGFDVCASSFAQDSELSASQLDAMPAEVQKILGYEKPAAKPAA